MPVPEYNNAGDFIGWRSVPNDDLAQARAEGRVRDLPVVEHLQFIVDEWHGCKWPTGVVSRYERQRAAYRTAEELYLAALRATEEIGRLQGEIAARDKTIQNLERRVALFTSKIPAGYLDRYVGPHLAALEAAEAAEGE